MTQRSIRRTTIAAVLAAVLALAAPAQAAGPHSRTAAPGWFETALQWMAHLGSGKAMDALLKQGIGIDPDGSPGSSAPPPAPTTDAGHGIDPNG